MVALRWRSTTETGSVATVRSSLVEQSLDFGVFVGGSSAVIEQCAIAWNGWGKGVYDSSARSTEILHCCVYGNDGGDDLPGNAHDNEFVDPLFCDAEADDYTLCADSPCAESNNDWDLLIGAHDIGCPDCDDTVDTESWGTIKALYK